MGPIADAVVKLTILWCNGTSRCLWSDKYKIHKYSVDITYSCWMLNLLVYHVTIRLWKVKYDPVSETFCVIYWSDSYLIFRAPLHCLVFDGIRFCLDYVRFCTNVARGCFPSKQEPNIFDISDRAKLRTRMLLAPRKFQKQQPVPSSQSQNLQ
jgi:hypothetical protein